MMAIDHRGSFRKVINPKSPEQVDKKEIVETKLKIINALAEYTSGVLVDVKTGLPAYELADSAKGKPLVLAIEKTGYIEKGDGRITELAYTVGQLKKLGAKAIKILIYFNPFSKTASAQLVTARKVLSNCRNHNIPLFLEIVTYHTEKTVKKGDNLVIESIKRFLAESIKPDVFKIEFPGSIIACQEITRMLKKTPWILLTRGENFYIFRHQLEIAVDYGCQGFLAGRALWQELGEYQSEKQKEFLEEIVKNRFKEISRIATSI